MMQPDLRDFHDHHFEFNSRKNLSECAKVHASKLNWDDFVVEDLFYNRWYKKSATHIERNGV